MNDEQHVKRRRSYSTAVIYVLLVMVVLFAIQLDDRNDKQREADRAADVKAAEKDRCIAAVDTREVLRSTIDAIYELATGVVKRDVNDPPLTPAEVVQYNAYINRLNDFRDEMYAKIKPSNTCEKYVKDDVVKPPEPSVAPLPTPKE